MPRREQRSRRWAQRRWGAVRWIVLVGTVPSIVAFAFVARSQDAFTWVAVLGGVPGALASLRMLGASTVGEANPYLPSTAAGPSGSLAPLRRFWGDLLWAALAWLAGSLVIAIVVAVRGDGSILAAPFFVLLIWAIGACLGAVGGVLVVYPVSLLVTWIAARRAGRPFHRGWIVAGAVLVLLSAWAVVALLASIALLEETPESPRRGRRALMWIMTGDISEFSVGLQVAAWSARGLMLAIAAVVVFAWLDGRKARKAERDALRLRRWRP